MTGNTKRLIQFGGPFTITEGNCIRNYGGVVWLLRNPDEFVAQCGARVKALQKDHISPDELTIPAGPLLDCVSTDGIIRVKDLLTDVMSQLGDRVLCGLRPEYQIMENTIRSLRPTVLVAGEKFGMGSSREQAVWALLEAGIQAVIAPSFGPIFRANAACLGLHLATNMELAAEIHRGQSVEFSHFLEGYDSLMADIIESGGLFKYLHDSKPRAENRLSQARPMNIWEKRLARAFGRDAVTHGDSGYLSVDCAYSYVGLSGLAKQTLIKHYGGVVRKLDRHKIVLFEDHFAHTSEEMPTLPTLTENQRQFAKELDLPEENYYYGLTGRVGISHRVMLGRVDPMAQRVVIATDSHTPTLGALPLVALPVGSTYFAAAIGEAAIPFSVGGVVRIELAGKLPEDTTIRDAQLAMSVAYKEKFPHAAIPVIEFGGDGLETLTFEEVVALTNMVPEMFNAEIAVTEAHEQTISYIAHKHGHNTESIRKLYDKPDINSHYEGILRFDLSETIPTVALPGNPTDCVSLSELKEYPKVNKVFIVSCTNGVEALIESASVLKEAKVHEDVYMVVTPSSPAAMQIGEKLGILDTLRKAGAVVSSIATCGACIGNGPDALKPGEIGISASNRNFPGRMGHATAKAYLASPLICALAARLGHLPNIYEYRQIIEQTSSIRASLKASLQQILQDAPSAHL